ncbi:MAG: VOC family protein [Cyanophyceae cyanobacterium]
MLNLVVIRVANIDRSRAFYEAIGLSFERHQHGSKGLPHFASVEEENQGVVFEIYPSAGKETVDVRLGFSVPDVDETLGVLTSQGGTVLSSAKDSPWGRRAVIKDLDGHKVELCQSA